MPSALAQDTPTSAFKFEFARRTRFLRGGGPAGSCPRSDLSFPTEVPQVVYGPWGCRMHDRQGSSRHRVDALGRAAQGAALRVTGCLRSNGLDEAELGERRDAIVETDLLDDLAVLETQDGGAGEVHFPAGRGRQRADQKVAEGRAGVRAAAFPLADDIVAFGDQVGGAPELEVRKGCTEVGHEGLDVFTAAARFVERVLQQHVRRGDVVDDGQITLLTPEFGEPADDGGLVVFFFAHVSSSRCNPARITDLDR